jgi:hypothetical protein
MVVIVYKLVLRYSLRRIDGGRLISTQTVRDVPLHFGRSILTVNQDIGEELRVFFTQKLRLDHFVHKVPLQGNEHSWHIAPERETHFMSPI